MIIDMGEQFGTRLQSEPKGKKDFVALCNTLSKVSKGTLVTLDFKTVETATASWWSAAILPLLRMSSDEQTDLYFVIANGLTADWLDDLRIVAQFNNQSFLISGKDLGKAILFGPLDEAYRRTVSLVQQMQVATGAKLAETFPEENVRPTAWNNRLRDLNEQRLLRRVRRGREQLYSPVTEVVTNDGRKLSARAGGKL